MSKLGKVLKEARAAAGYSIADVTSALKINKEVLGQLEAGDYYDLPSYVYAYGFVKTYSEYLKLDFNEVKPLFDEECTKVGFAESPENLLPPVECKPARFDIPKFKIGIGVAVFLLIVSVVIYINYASNKSQEALIENKSISNESLTPAEKEPVEKSETKEVIKKEVVKDVVKEKLVKKVTKKTVVKKKVKMPDVTPNEVVKSLEAEEKKVTYKYNASIEFSDTCWVHINLDDRSHLDFIADPGMKKRINFNDYFVMDMGNAAVVSVVHGKDRISGFGGFRQPAKHLKFSINDNGTMQYIKLK